LVEEFGDFSADFLHFFYFFGLDYQRLIELISLESLAYIVAFVRIVLLIERSSGDGFEDQRFFLNSFGFEVFGDGISIFF
jgi:hypothetical protein